MTAYQNGWTALGDPTRRDIFERLADAPRSVGEIAEVGLFEVSVWRWPVVPACIAWGERAGNPANRYKVGLTLLQPAPVES